MAKMLAYTREYAFNAICPYYTMFPLEYPLRIIRKHRKDSPVVFDPFCGRGTTLYAARRNGLSSYGLDTSPIATSIAKAKLARAPVKKVIDRAREFISTKPEIIPTSLFFQNAFHPTTLRQICSLREGLLSQREVTGVDAILRAAALGCLHGPLTKGGGTASYFSNQMPRTFASKPDYSVKFWTERGLQPPKVDIIQVLQKKLVRIPDLNRASYGSSDHICCSDARQSASYDGIPLLSLIITSPPYYGMRTYVEDQWLRMWFLGGADHVDYGGAAQVSHSGHEAFISDLALVWRNLLSRCEPGAHLYVRFGVLPSVKSDAKGLVKASLKKADGWKLLSVRSANTSAMGKRQAHQMGSASTPESEYDFHAVFA